MLKLWIVGASGQIGRAINEELDPLEYEVFNSDSDEVDITKIDEVLNFALVNHPDIIINCAGVTDFEYCEKNYKKAFLVNAIGARNLSIAAERLSAKFVQISTDDVFDGVKKEAYNEFDKVNPLSVYGKSKLAGEKYVKEFTFKHFIIRSSWVYGAGENFLTEILTKAKEGKCINAAVDQFGSPTSANVLARFILELVNTNKYGVYHVTCEGICNRYELAIEALKLAKIDKKVNRISVDDLEYSELFPVFATLDNFILGLEDIKLPSWKESLKEYLQKHTD